MIARRALALGLAVSLTLSACASYKGSAALIPTPEAMPASATAGSLAVSADPYVTKDRIKPVFDGDLIDEGVLPIQVVVRNGSDKRMLVRGADMILALPGGTQLSSAGATAVASRFEQGIGDVIGWGIGFGVIGMLAASANKEKVRAARLADYRSKELSEAFLAPGESAHGFVFFIPPKGTPDLSDAMLTVRFVDIKDGSRESVQLPLRGLAFTARASASATPAPAAAAPAMSTAPVAAAGAPSPTGVAAVAIPAASVPRPPLNGTWRGTDGSVLEITGHAGKLEWELETREARIGAFVTTRVDYRVAGAGKATDDDVVLEGRIVAAGGFGGYALHQPVTLTLRRDGARLRGTGIGAANVPFTVEFERRP